MALSTLRGQLQDFVEKSGVYNSASWVVERPWTAVAVLPVAYTLMKYWKNRNLPPGPAWVPFWGSTFPFTDDMFSDFSKLEEKYGDVFSVYIGGRLTIVLNSYRVIKEAFVKRGADFASRPPLAGLHHANYHDQIFNCPYSEKFRQDKKFAMKALQSFGVGSSSLEAKLLSEIDRMCNWLTNKTGEKFDPKWIITRMLACMMVSIHMNKQYDEYSDPELEFIIQSSHDWFRITLVDVEFGVERYGQLYMDLFRSKSMKDSVQATNAVVEFVKKQVDEHRATHEVGQERDIIDYYLTHRKDIPEKDLVETLAILYPDGIVTLADGFHWLFLHLAQHQDVQRKACEEIEKVTGGKREATLDDRAELGYIEAFGIESFRISSPVSLSFRHCALNDTTLYGYRIPKEAHIFANFWAAHQDPTLFPEPDKFDPERYLGPNGKLMKTETWMPFGIGRRICVAEQLSKTQCYLFLANILQRFHFQFPDNEGYPEMATATQGQWRRPKSFNIIAVPKQFPKN